MKISMKHAMDHKAFSSIQFSSVRVRGAAIAVPGASSTCCGSTTTSCGVIAVEKQA